MKVASIVLFSMLLSGLTAKANDLFIGIESWILSPGIGLYFEISEQKLTVTEIHDHSARPKVAFTKDLTQSQLDNFSKALKSAKHEIKYGKIISLKFADGGQLLVVRKHSKSCDNSELFKIQNLLIPEILTITELIDDIVPEAYKTRYDQKAPTPDDARVTTRSVN